MPNITVLKHIYPTKGDDVFLIPKFQAIWLKELYCYTHTYIPYYTLAVLTIKSSGVLFIPLLHAEHVYNEGHGVCHDKSHIVSPDTISFKTIFVDTPVLGFSIGMRYMSLKACGKFTRI